MTTFMAMSLFCCIMRDCFAFVFLHCFACACFFSIDNNDSNDLHGNIEYICDLCVGWIGIRLIQMCLLYCFNYCALVVKYSKFLYLPCNKYEYEIFIDPTCCK